MTTNAPIRRGGSPRDRYEQDLLDSNWAGTKRLEQWRVAGRRALRERLEILPSFKEEIRLPTDVSHAVGYRLDLRRGQRVRVEVERQGAKGLLFAEVFEEINPPSAMFRLLYSPHPDARSFEYEATADGAYVIRLQPDLNGGGAFAVTVSTEAGLRFPVYSAGLKSIGSWFGDARDGGARDHEGVDIFAPKGTPVIAVSDGVITGVSTTARGGRVVWQSDPSRGVSYYYAHLEEQAVSEGERVKEGDRIGTVGNTGNARTTPPHLHFSVYLPGQVAVNPVPFLYDERGETVRAVIADTRWLGSWVDLGRSAVRLRSGPSTEAPIIAELGRATRVRLLGAVSDWNRVVLEDGTTGFIAGRLLENGAVRE